jgi:hypothetical protein
MTQMPPFTHDDARRRQLLDGIALDTRAKVAFFEEMVALAVHFGGRNRHRDSPNEAGKGCDGEGNQTASR